MNWDIEIILLLFVFVGQCWCDTKPIIVTTWPFIRATEAGWHVLSRLEGSAVDAVVAGGTECENEPCAASVGFGGSPDEHGETTLDAMIMDGTTYDVGAVANLHNISNAIGVAHAVMKYTKHTLLVGPSATDFAVMMGFSRANLTTRGSVKQWHQWRQANCQPNFWQNVLPDPESSCGPYWPAIRAGAETTHRPVSSYDNHDTVGIVAIDRHANIAAGTSTNGATFKIPGRVGDSPIVGSGAYADSKVGAAAATGDGDLMMRMLPSFLCVELMRSGASVRAAADIAIARIGTAYPQASAALIAVNASGQFSAACHGFANFSYSVMTDDMKSVQVMSVPCTHAVTVT